MRFKTIILAALSLLAAAAGAAPAPCRIAVDIGHSAHNPGATSARGVPEFTLNKSLATVIADALNDATCSTFTIGASGNINQLVQRTNIAGAQNATFLLSIHHDSVHDQYLRTWNWKGKSQKYSDRFSGFSLFVSRNNPAPAQSLRCASAMGRALQQRGLHVSEHHAEPIAGESREWADRAHGVYYYDNLVVLKTASMPAVLVEAGVIVNRADEAALQQPSMQQTIAAAIGAGLRECGAR